MSDKPVSATVSALRQVLARSVAITEQLDLKQGSWWEYTGFDKYARALQAEYQTLVDLRTEIAPRLVPTLRPEIIELNEEMGSLRLWADRPEERTFDIRLSSILWQD